MAPSAVDEEPELDEPEVEQRRCTLPVNAHGVRLDRVLTQIVPEFSRSYLQQLIALGAVTLNGSKCTKPSTRTKAGEELVVELRPTQESQAFLPDDLPLSIVYEDADLLVIDKPAGLVVHPAPGNWRGTLLNGLLARYPEAGKLPRGGIVHRLDKDTSGLMVVAKTRRAMEKLVKMIAARDISREYLAIAHGTWQGRSELDVDQSIGRDRRNRLRMAVVDETRQAGKVALTTVSLLHNNGGQPGFCLVRCRLGTGRTHQIRVHMAFLGHPLVGDLTYGGRVVNEMKRQALHAYRLVFEHPLNARRLQFESLPPADYLNTQTTLGLGYNEIT